MQSLTTILRRRKVVLSVVHMKISEPLSLLSSRRLTLLPPSSNQREQLQAQQRQPSEQCFPLLDFFTSKPRHETKRQQNNQLLYADGPSEQRAVKTVMEQHLLKSLLDRPGCIITGTLYAMQMCTWRLHQFDTNHAGNPRSSRLFTLTSSITFSTIQTSATNGSRSAYWY
jgi:hypothetical protein